jgi:hypothetical protein
VNREPIAVALFNLLKGITYNDGTSHTFATASRRAKIEANSDIGEQPAFYLIANEEQNTQEDMGLTLYRYLKYVALFYFKASDDWNSPPLPDTTINAILQAVETALPVNGSLQDLRGAPGANYTWPNNVINVWIEGTIVKVGGIVDSQCAVLVPIVVLCGIQ